MNSRTGISSPTKQAPVEIAYLSSTQMDSERSAEFGQTEVDSTGRRSNRGSGAPNGAGILGHSERHTTHLEFSAAGVPFSVLSAVLGAAICRYMPVVKA